MTQSFNRNKGDIFPEYTTTTRNARSDWKLGDTITNTTTGVNQYYDGVSAWVDLSGGGGTPSIEQYDNTKEYGGGDTDSCDMCSLGEHIFSYYNKTASTGNSPTIGGDAYWDEISVVVSSLTNKAVPVSSDMLLIEDSENNYYKKKILIGDLPSSGGGAFESDSGVVKEVSTAYTDDFVFGSPTTEDDGTSDHDRRMLFDKSNGSFRVGQAQSTQWDIANRGEGSLASGKNNIASGSNTIASGYAAEASGSMSMAVGLSVSALSVAEVAFGRYPVLRSASPTTWSAANNLFVIGIGADAGNRADAFRVTKNGYIYIGNSTQPVNHVYAEDDLSSNSNVGLATQASIKAYVDSKSISKLVIPISEAIDDPDTPPAAVEEYRAPDITTAISIDTITAPGATDYTSYVKLTNIGDYADLKVGGILVIANATNSVNNGSFIIDDVQDTPGNDFIEIYNPAGTVTESSSPATATSKAATVVQMRRFKKILTGGTYHPPERLRFTVSLTNILRDDHTTASVYLNFVMPDGADDPVASPKDVQWTMKGTITTSHGDIVSGGFTKDVSSGSWLDAGDEAKRHIYYAGFDSIAIPAGTYRSAILSIEIKRNDTGVQPQDAGLVSITVGLN